MWGGEVVVSWTVLSIGVMSFEIVRGSDHDFPPCSHPLTGQA